MPVIQQTITRESMRKVLEDIVGEYGRDYVYEPPVIDGEPACVYQRDGAPSCLFGHALERLGVPYNDWWEFDAINGVLRYHLGVQDEGLIEACRESQVAQDQRRTWGQALDLFITNIGGDAVNPA